MNVEVAALERSTLARRSGAGMFAPVLAMAPAVPAAARGQPLAIGGPDAQVVASGCIRGVAAMPGWRRQAGAFIDSAEAAGIGGGRVEPGALGRSTCARLADGRGAQATLRAQLPTGFAPVARDARFRAEVAAHLAAHPEWVPVAATAENRPRKARGANR